VFTKAIQSLLRRPPRAPAGGRLTDRSPVRLSVETLEERALLNVAWGNNGPPLVVNTAAVPARSVSLNADGDAAGKAGIRKSEVDYYRFTPKADGFYRLIARAKFDAIVGIYDGPAGNLLGYSDRNYSGVEKFTAYLEAGRTYYLGVSNYRRSPGGAYKWRIDDVDVVTSLSAPTAGTAKHKLYLNFDGAFIRPGDLRSWDDDWEYGAAAELDPRGDGITVSPLLDYRGDRETIINRIMDLVQEDLAPFGVRVVRLPAGSSAVTGVYATTVFLGPATLEDRSLTSTRRELFHVAGDIDVGNNNRTDIAFVSDEDWGSAADTAFALADVVLHEAGHTYGLFHVHSGNHAETMGLRYSRDDSDDWLRDTGLLNRSFYLSEAYGSQDSYQIVAAAFGVGGTLQPLSVSASTASPASTVAAWRAEERLLYSGPFRHHDHDHAHDHDHDERDDEHGMAARLWHAFDVGRRDIGLAGGNRHGVTVKRRDGGAPSAHLWGQPRPHVSKSSVRRTADRHVSTPRDHVPRDHVFASLDSWATF
jgi:hypothetical protein